MMNIFKCILSVLIGASSMAYCNAQSNWMYADSVRQANQIPELNYAVVSANKVLELAALGHHAIHLKDTATLNDRFHLGSNTKAMTAFIAAKCVEKGWLKWSTHFFDLFPEWKSKANTAYKDISLQDLLTHRARIQPFQGEDDPIIPNFEGSKQAKRAAFGQFVLSLDPVPFDSINHYTYSNADYTLATLMLEKVSGKSWEELVVWVFNKKLHLNVQFSWPENQTTKDTWGHTFDANDQMIAVPSTTDYHLDYTEPAGDLNIKLNDYIKFIQLNLAGLGGKHNFLKAKTYQFIHKGTDNYALGWFNSYENNTDYSTHMGTAGTYYSLVAIDRQHLLAYIIFTNAPHSPQTANGIRLLMRRLKKVYSR